MQTTNTHQNDFAPSSTGLWLPQGYQQPKKRHWTEKTLAGKTRWDWMSLLLGVLLIPLCVGVGTILVTNRQTDAQNALSQQLHDSDRHQHDSDQEIALQTRYDDLLKEYRDGIDQLLLENNLRTSVLGSDVQRIAHSRTLDILRQVDLKRKSLVISYLSDLGLVQGGTFDDSGDWHAHPPIISLTRANLSYVNLSYVNLRGADFTFADLNHAYLAVAYLSYADLREAKLYHADLGGATLTRTNLSSADLSYANLAETNLIEADFTNANLGHADLTGAGILKARFSYAFLDYANLSYAALFHADFSYANLTGANLGHADLTGANLGHADLTGVNLSGTLMPDGTHQPCKQGDEIYCRS